MAELTHAGALVVDFRTADSVVRELRRLGRLDLRARAIKALVDETRAGGTGRAVLQAVVTMRRQAGATQ